VHGYRHSGASSLEAIDRGDVISYQRETVKFDEHKLKYEKNRLRAKVTMNMNVM